MAPVPVPASAAASVASAPSAPAALAAPSARSALPVPFAGAEPGSTAMAISVISSAASPRHVLTACSPCSATFSYVSRAFTAYSAAAPTPRRARLWAVSPSFFRSVSRPPISSVTLLWSVACASFACAVTFSCTAFGSVLRTASSRDGASAAILRACCTARSAVPAAK